MSDRSVPDSQPSWNFPRKHDREEHDPAVTRLQPSECNDTDGRARDYFLITHNKAHLYLWPLEALEDEVADETIIDEPPMDAAD